LVVPQQRVYGFESVKGGKTGGSGQRFVHPGVVITLVVQALERFLSKA
jgi:hypothetical protein